MPSNPITYTVKQIADELGVSVDTVRRYSTHFARHLSEDASPDAGTMRLFTPADLYVLRIARQQMRSGKTYEETDRYLESVEVPEDVDVYQATSIDLATTATLQQVTSALLSISEALEHQEAMRERAERTDRRLDALSEARSHQDATQARIAQELEAIRRNQEQLARATARPLFWAIVGAFVSALVVLATVALALVMGWIG